MNWTLLQFSAVHWGELLLFFVLVVNSTICAGLLWFGGHRLHGSIVFVMAVWSIWAVWVAPNLGGTGV